ncbi:SsgA family sporulation/cell division regulator [Streptomyces yangpuensis]|uniref:SsgA family sporulation/cell division regulator n=1 Tax=Streptomyces yangpuensis TaxID=1648182 RepID=UPI00382CE345
MSSLIAVRLETDGGTVLLLARLSYAADQPYTVRADFFDGPAVLASWQFDREMLVEGLSRPVGEGDVTLRPHREAGGDEVRIALRSHADGLEGQAVLFVDVGALTGFLDRTYEVVGEGEEFLDLDTLLQEFLAR